LGTMLSLIGSSMMDGGTRLRDLLSEEDYKMVDAHFQKVGMPLMLFERVKPMFLSAMVGQDMNDLSGGLGGSSQMKSYEFELKNMAVEEEKDIMGLETIDFQLSLFDSIPYRFQAKMLLDAIVANDATAGEGQFADMVKMYKRQAIAEMSTMISEESSGSGNFEELLLVKRNQNWVPAMAEQMAKESTFFAVGAGHLASNQGVIALLRAEGYVVEPVFE
ncbi:MAG: TraB/GumN family protein, partial [Bacteroidota bacterium]